MNHQSLLQNILEALLEEETVEAAYMMQSLAEELEAGHSMDADEVREVIKVLAEDM